MAKEQENIYRECKTSTSSEDNEEYEEEEEEDDDEEEEDEEDLRVIAVVENNETDGTVERCSVTEMPENVGSNAMKASAKKEIIILDEAPIGRTNGNNEIDARNAIYHCNPRVIELSDDKSKMELRREFKVDVARPGPSNDDSSELRKSTNFDNVDNEEVDTSADILSRLPPGTILIKQSAKCSIVSAATTRTCNRDDSDYVHDSSKDSTNSSESSSNASYNATGKIRRMQYRSVRSKKVVEVRRNPARNKKKKPIDDETTRPRQRLLSAKRKTNLPIEGGTRKRAKTTPAPYMNTRSVTRKMYTVGATYQAPTVKDALEWKEWPSHGMHERPIWHPQVGLAYEYNERTYVNLDGQNYREIIEEPVIEVVSVDPHSERFSGMADRRNFDRMQYYGVSRGLHGMDDRKTYIQGNPFQACVHGSFHSVLAYCARVVTPNYNRNIDMKIRTFGKNEPGGSRCEKFTEMGKSTQNAKMRIPSTVVPPVTKMTEMSNLPSSNIPGEVPKCLVIPRKTIHFTNVRNIQGNVLQEVFNRSSKNTLIFLKPTEPPGKSMTKMDKVVDKSATMQNPKINPGSKDYSDTANAQLNLKLEDGAISDETLMEMSSMYNNLLTNDDHENSGLKTFKAPNYLPRPVTALVATKIATNSSEENQSKNSRTPGANYRTDPRLARDASLDPTRFTYTNQATEIAKILAEYNQKAINSGTRNYSNANVMNVRTSAKTLNNLNQSSESRNLFSVMEPKNLRVKREQELYNFQNSLNLGRKYDSYRQVSATVTSETSEQAKNEENQAIDLTKPRKNDTEKNEKPEEPRKWLQEFIEDTAILCNATSSDAHQGDVSEYMNTLDSVQNMQWLGS